MDCAGVELKKSRSRRHSSTMEVVNLLEFKQRCELRKWLVENHQKKKECWVVAYRKNQPEWDALPYKEIVEEALCFGWIDSTNKKLPDGRLCQRISPRRKGSHWTQRNIERCADMLVKGLMTEAGLLAIPQEFSAKVRHKPEA